MIVVLEKMSDDELIRISNGDIPFSLSAKNTITADDLIIQAKIILHRRETKREQTITKMTLSILVLTIILTILTGILVHFSIIDNPISKFTDMFKFSQSK